MRRFWQVAEASAVAAGYVLLLDGKAHKTPAGRDYLCSTLALAEALAQEWRAAPAQFDPRAMPLSQLVATAHDRIEPERGQIITALAILIEHDLLAMRVTEPEALAQMQQQSWQPYLDWAQRIYDLELSIGHSLQHRQTPETVARCRKILSELNAYQLTALREAAGLTGSVILALALITSHAPAAEILAAAELEALFQRQIWGEDPEASLRYQALAQELAQLEKFLGL
jgi:chaperone required for assembly of F1-ATPase